MLKIGNVQLESPVILAPMAGVSDQAYKRIARELGKEMMSTEMVSDKALINENERTLKMIEIHPDEHPVALQIFGNEIDSMVAAAKILDTQTTCDIIDINMGCPAPKIIKNNGGSKLLLDTDHIYNLVKAIVEAVDKPVTVKIRIGFEEVNAVQNAQAIERAGASAICVHGRTRVQGYSGLADWDVIKQVKEAVSIPVIGNGDIKSPEDAKIKMEYSGVDGVMVGRAALGNPWILSQITEYLQEDKTSMPKTPQEKITKCLAHMEKLVELNGEKRGMLKMRTHAAWYLKEIPGANAIKGEIGQITTMQQLRDLFDDFLQGKYVNSKSNSKNNTEDYSDDLKKLESTDPEMQCN